MLAFERDHRTWRKINFRQTSTLLAAEFLHNLYQRHNPFLNPFRFANTAVVFTPWTTTSYAPVEEWDRLAVRFGDRFIRDHEALCAELDRTLAHTRPRSRALAAELDATRFYDLGDGSLMDALIRLQHVPLGEIYEVNLVQVEHALHAALQALLADGHAGRDEVDRMIADLCRSQLATVAHDQEKAFLKVVLRAREAGIREPSAVRDELMALVRQHGEVGAGYGAQTVSIEGIEHRFRQYVQLSTTELRQRLGKPTQQVQADNPVDPRAVRLAQLMQRVGEVRDRNKQLLGTVTKHRTALLADVCRRSGVPTDDLRLYLLEEVLRLVEDGARVPRHALRRRLDSGVTFIRRECAAWPEAWETGQPAAPVAKTAAPTRLTGLCASSGRHTGTARVVTSSADLGRMRIGDVVVASGTDFDLILLLQMAGAIVTEEGGLLSHAAVIARELSIPCVIGVGDATRVLVDGVTVTVDGDAGRVEQHGPSDRPSVPTAPAGGAVPEAVADLLVELSADLPVELVGRKAAGLCALRSSGMPVPEPCLVVPTTVCARMNAALDAGDQRLVEQVAELIVAAVPADAVSLRSSSTLEDMPDGTAAGIYHSEAGVPARPDAVATVLARILRSRTSDRAQAYHQHHNRDSDGGLAILVTEYQRFSFQGTALSHDPWHNDQTVVEYYESDGSGGCPDRGGEVVCFPHATLASRAALTTIPHLMADLNAVARAAYALSQRAGSPIEVEWGLREHRLTLLQARQIAPPHQGT